MSLALWIWTAASLFPSGEDPVEDLCRAFSSYDHDGDGIREIGHLRPLKDIPTAAKLPARLVVVLVEERLLGEGLDLRPALKTFARDLLAEGWDVRFLSAQVYAGPRHQDGLTLLALRAFFRKVRAQVPRLAGAVLVGSFPEAMLVRSYNWRKKGPLVLHKGKKNEKRFGKETAYLRTVPELVAHRAEIVLCDLDGEWDGRYRRERQRLRGLTAVFPGGVPPRGGVVRDYEWSGHVFEDFFYVNDGHFEAHEVLDEKGKVAGLSFVPEDNLEDAECSPADRARRNPMAYPEFLVSRINARGVGLERKAGRWEYDAALERRLLAEYFARNHRYRRGEFRAHFKPAAIAHHLGSGFGAVRRASKLWKSFNEKGYHVGTESSVIELVEWLKRPAILRDVRAHTSPTISVFGKADPAALEKACGGAKYPLAGTAKSGRAGFVLYRTLWENRVLPDGASFYFHTGCDSVSPPHAMTRPYSDPAYGRIQGGESMLFYAQGLALVGRAKVFYDAPRGFYAALAEGKTFGEAWARYFEIEAGAKSAREVGGGIGRKRAYFWSVIGDWTLRLR